VSTSCANTQTRVIVVPRPLADYFCERLSRLYEGRPDVRVVVDRRVEQRRSLPAPALTMSERRTGDRRADAIYWSLEKMPFAASGD
jgi:hypothetical protein